MVVSYYSYTCKYCSKSRVSQKDIRKEAKEHAFINEHTVVIKTMKVREFDGATSAKKALDRRIKQMAKKVQQ